LLCKNSQVENPQDADFQRPYIALYGGDPKSKKYHRKGMVSNVKQKQRLKNANPRNTWHPAFIEALQMELQEYEGALEFHPEYQLTAEPLRIDCIVIKKTKNIVIKKNIAVIFRGFNLLEYKSPGKSVSVADFYKVYAYACLYAYINKVPITGLTISFIESSYPQKLIKHLKNERGYKIAETSPGIYTIDGDVLPIQIIDSRKLSLEENLWLKGLSKEHNKFTISRINREINKKGKAAQLDAYLYVIISANYKAAKEAVKMSRMSKNFDRFLEETGLAAKAEARGEARGKAKGREEGRMEERGVWQSVVADKDAEIARLRKQLKKQRPAS